MDAATNQITMKTVAKLVNGAPRTCDERVFNYVKKCCTVKQILSFGFGNILQATRTDHILALQKVSNSINAILQSLNTTRCNCSLAILPHTQWHRHYSPTSLPPKACCQNGYSWYAFFHSFSSLNGNSRSNTYTNATSNSPIDDLSV